MRSKELQKGFTLIELVAVILLMAALSYTVVLGLTHLKHNRIDAKQKIISAIQHARVLSMTRGIKEGDIKVLLEAETVSLLFNGRSYQPEYPVTFSQPLELKEDKVELVFNGFGETQERRLTVNIGKHSEVIQVESTGYAY